MDKVVYFKNDDQRTDYCSGAVYRNFLEYAFSRTDYFMLVYVNYYGKGYSGIMKSFMRDLKPFQVKVRSNPSWPGTTTFCPNTHYKVVFYRNCPQAKEILNKVDRLSAWSRPSYPQDLAFFSGTQCWFYSVGHEKIAAVLHASNGDISFLAENGLASPEKAFTPQGGVPDDYDEMLEDNEGCGSQGR